MFQLYHQDDLPTDIYKDTKIFPYLLGIYQLRSKLFDKVLQKDLVTIALIKHLRKIYIITLLAYYICFDPV